MANKKAPGFILERDQKAIIDELTNEEAGIIFKAIYDYETTKQEPKLDKSLRIVFKQFKVKLDFYDEKYDTKCKTNKKNIQDYWNKIKDTNEYDGIQSNTMATNKRKENKIKENKNSECSDNKIYSRNTPPTTPTQIFDFALTLDENYEEKSLKTSCKKFFNYYEGKKWQGIDNWQNKLKFWLDTDLEKGILKLKQEDVIEYKNGFKYINGKRIL